MPKVYRLRFDREAEPRAIAGTLVYECEECDYGCARDDSRMLDTPCISVTLNKDGSYPFFVAPRTALMPISLLGRWRWIALHASRRG